MCKENPCLVSVCLITYNHEPFIREAIEGVLSQITSFTVELVIGEDFGEDKTREICQEYINKGANINLLESKSNLGAMANYIRTLEACRGRYIAILEGDDYWTDKFKLQKQVDFFEAGPQYGYVHTDFDYFDVRSNTIIQNYYATNKIRIPTGKVLMESINTPCVRSLTVCVRKEIVLKLMPVFNLAKKKGYFNGDMILLLGAAYYSEIGYLPDSTGIYRRQMESISSSDNPEIKFKFLNSLFGSKLLCIDYLGLDRQKYKSGFVGIRVLLEYSLYLHKRVTLIKTYLFMKKLGLSSFKDKMFIGIEKNRVCFGAYYWYNRISNKCDRVFSKIRE